MGLELYDEKDNDLIPMHELKGGQIAVIEDTSSLDYIGEIVTREGEKSIEEKSDFVIVGGLDQHNEYASSGFSFKCELLVRVLPPGTLLKIT